MCQPPRERPLVCKAGAGWQGYCQVVPRVSTFYGVVIYMYWNERDHPVAHFHAFHAGRRASVSADGQLLAGSLEPRAAQTQKLRLKTRMRPTCRS